RRVVGVATTNQAVNQLRDVGVEAVTLARLRIDLQHNGLAAGTVLVLDEVSQVATADAAWLLDVANATPGCRLWCLGDPNQAGPVRAGGLAAELARLTREGVPAEVLTKNRRQIEPAERHALEPFRAGDVADSQALPTQSG